VLLVFGPRSTDYDFGPGHPLTPRRFGPGIDLLRAVGAEPGLAPEPAPDADLLLCHTREYIEVVRRSSVDPYGFPEGGIGLGDNPAFPDMHEAGAAVAGGSLRAMEAILRGDVEHAQHPGGGLHHAMPDHAWGFCIYNDPALAIARARQDGKRVMYIDLDVHHGDGVQAIHWADPGVLTISIHETGRYLFPQTGFPAEIGEGVAAGTSVNVPLLPWTGERAWTAVIEALLPELAATFGPDLIVSQHGADSHAWDPLAHLAVTTTAHGAAARLVDRLAHRYAGGRWLATGGGGYDAYRVVPRTWALTWLAGAHREVPPSTPAAWRERWADEAARYGQAPLPESFDDAPNAGLEFDAGQAAAEEASIAEAALVRRVLVPRLVREARDRGWWDPLAAPVPVDGDGLGPVSGAPTVIAQVDAAVWSRLTLAPSVIPPAAPADGHAIVAGALADGARVSAAVRGSSVVGLVVSRDADDAARTDVLALGVAPADRRHGLATAMIRAHLEGMRPGDVDVAAEVTVAERDPYDPLDRRERMSIARRLLEGAGFEVHQADPDVRSIDPSAIAATLSRVPG
jgi:acetoin utilization protein AcuC